MQIAYSQINPTLGDIKGNTKIIIRDILEAKKNNVDLVVFPEFSLVGYLPQDLLEQSSLLKKSTAAIERISKVIPANMRVVVGSFRKDKNDNLYNCAFVLSNGKIVKTCDKVLLPNYDVFDESRYFLPGSPNKNHFKFKGKKILISICEDLWCFHPDSAYKNIYKGEQNQYDLVINICASPYSHTKKATRHVLVENARKFFKADILYVNLVGGQDELIFDGNSFFMDKKGKVLSRSLRFKEHLNYINLSDKKTSIKNKNPANKIKQAKEALILGLRDFVKKNNFEQVHLGLSGGIDSALVAALAVDALGAKNVTCIAMPSRYNAEESLSLAKQLAKNLKCKFKVLEIEPMYKVVSSHLEAAWNVKDFGLMHENLQARIRGISLMSYANLQKSLLLSTGNKSELAVGYSTLYGDMCGALAPIGDLLKTEVIQMSYLYNKEGELIPARIIERPPSAELRPDQKDSDTLPPYKKLDKEVKKFVVTRKNLSGQNGEKLMSQILRSEFKRRQAPPILKISSKSFGRGRRYPITQKLL